MSARSILSTFPGARMLRQTPEILRSLLASATPEDLDWQPSPERWSISMVLAHLANVELKTILGRLRAIAEEDNPFLPSYDQLEQFRSRKKFHGRAELAKFEQRRRDTLIWLNGLPASAGARTGRHEELGTLTFNELLHECAFHDLGHIRQVIELYRAHAFYPHMGAFQSYYKINP